MIEEDEVTDEDLMQVVKGPDFPTGALILGKEGIKQAYTTGRGKITLRAEAEIEEMSGNKQRIIVSSLPYQVNKAKLIEHIAELVKDKRNLMVGGVLASIQPNELAEATDLHIHKKGQAGGIHVGILRPGDNIDTASSALRNYNSTVTKGNTNRNIQDLENLFVKDV